MSDLYERLSEPFPVEMEKTLRKGGVNLTYIPVSEVITRLNRVIGIENWSSTIVKCDRDALDPDYIVAHVRLVATIDDKVVSKDGFGGQKIKRMKNGEIVDLGDEMKGAVSDALKKAAQQLGVGLYLARDADAIEVELEQDAALADVDEHADAVRRFKEIKDMLNDEQTEHVKQWLLDYHGGNKVKFADMSVGDLNAAIVEMVRVQFNGTVAVDADEDN